jgi:lipopolysaccharide transport system permease protein
MSDPLSHYPLKDYFLPWRHSQLLRQLWERELAQRYRQSWLGLGWLLLTPLCMLAVYTLVFRHVMQVRWPQVAEALVLTSEASGSADLMYALRIYTGLAVFLFFAECVNRAPTLVLEQPNLVKKVVFPLHLLPWVSAATSATGLVVALILIALLALSSGVGLHATLLLLPFVWLALLPWTLGLSWLLAGLGAYVRDVGQVLSLLVSALMFLSPVFFPVESLPLPARSWLNLNPLAPVVTATREAAFGSVPHAVPLLAVALSGAVVALGGALFFRRVRAGFADVV